MSPMCSRGRKPSCVTSSKSIVLQVNSELPHPEEPDTETESKLDEEARVDRQMTVAFKVFADD